MPSVPEDWPEQNRRMWDERVPIHVSSRFYDVEGFKAGRPALEPFEVEELGAIGGLDLVHLQCHFGLDTLDLVRLHPTLQATGLDFSEPALAAARALAADLHLDDRTTFVHSDVRRAVETLGPESFDVVFTGLGAICWLPDLDHWAGQCSRLLRPGGFLYLAEFHPAGNLLGQERAELVDDYFRAGPWVEDQPGSYADLGAETVHNLSYSWNHTIASVMGALIGSGLRIQLFHEWDYSVFAVAPWLIRDADAERYRWPADSPGRLPLMYSLKAYKPG